MRARRGVRPVPPAAGRSLRIYALDPLLAGSSPGAVTVQVPFEPLRPGPIGERVEVIDFDPALGRYYAPVDLDHPNVLAQDGLPPSESDPRFHQQMVYAVVMTTLTRFEHALGRRISWGLKRPKLRIYPHGTTEANAYFSPELGALVFGYFRASKRDPGRNLPGGYVFTCLSHDVIAHETTHALVHGARERFMEPTNPDTLAFHEAFADLVAMLQHFSLPGVVESAIQQTRASLDDIKPLVQLGRQLIEAVGARGALRAALGEPADPRALLRTHEAHERGAILVAAVFAAMLQVYRRRSADLLRIATGGTGLLPPGHIAPDLVHRLAGEARKTASHFLNMCIRALDYCPPIDIDFGEFLRAVITVDRELEPDDPWEYRAALIEAFRERGILPRKVFSLAESSVMWNAFEGSPDVSGLSFESIRFHRSAFDSGTPRAYFRLFEEFVNRRKNQRLFRLDPRRRTRVVSVQPLRRIGPDRRIHDEIVVELLQSGPPLSKLEGAPPYRGGSTLVLSKEGRVRYVIYKPYAMRERLERQRAYLADLSVAAGAHAYRTPRLALGLAGIHRGI